MARWSRTLGAVLFADFEPLDLYGPLEVFGLLGPRLRIVTVARAAGPVASAAGVRTVADEGFDDCPPLDLLLVPGGIGTEPALGDDALLEFLRSRAPRAERVMSVCTGAALLARAGLLDGRRATTNKQLFRHAREQSDAVHWVPSARWVSDGPFVTASGISAGIDMALAVIADLYGTGTAEAIATRAEYLWHREPDDDPFAEHLDAADMGALRRAMGRAPS